MKTAKLREIAAKVARHPAGSPGGIGGRFAPKDPAAGTPGLPGGPPVRAQPAVEAVDWRSQRKAKKGRAGKIARIDKDTAKFVHDKSGAPPPGYESVIALRAYTDSSYRKMNKALRGDEPMTDDVAYLIAQADKGLEEMPKYQDQVYRGATLPREVVSQYRVGEVIEERAFTSSSIDTDVAFDFARMRPGQVRTRYTIQSKTGVYISRISEFGEDEREVLFRPNTRFRVGRVQDFGDDIQIELEEV